MSGDDSTAMLGLLTDLMARVPAPCTYAEARHVTTEHEQVLVRNGHVEQIDSESAEGIGVRVRAGGGWGFAATRDSTSAGLEQALTRALAIAESQPSAPVGPLAAVDPARGRWSCAHEQDPLAVSLEHKLELLCAAEIALRSMRASCARRPSAPAAACAAPSPPPRGPR